MRHRILLWHAAAILTTLLESEQAGIEITISELIQKTGISPSLFHTSLKKKFIDSGLIELKRNPDRTITVRLTDKGRKLAECLLPCRDLILDG